MATTIGIPLVVIVGPTASGKTGLAIQLAKEFGGEIISADSRAIYRYMDIGTAKPTIAERDGIPHWGIDLVDPDERFSAADFKAYAEKKIEEIKARGHIPFLVGGTGLYIDGVLLDFSFVKNDLEKRAIFEQMSLEDLHIYCEKNNVTLPENTKNKRYVINNILRNGYTPKMKTSPRHDAIVVGITTDRDVLRQRIDRRVDQMFQLGVIDEARELASRFGWHSGAMSANIYQYVHSYLEGLLSLEATVESVKTSDWHLAKRQLTWFKRRDYIQWMELEGARTMLTQILAHLNNS